MSNKLIVAAIDFGTTYSGYAYSFYDEYKKNPLQIHMNTNWSDGGTICVPKAPGVVLFDKDGKFHSFGFEAEAKYAQLASEPTEETKDSESPEYGHVGWKYFKRFKMELFKQRRLKLTTTMKDDQNKSILAIDVFSTAIRYLKDHMFKRMAERLTGEITEKDVQWVITVPAIWENSAKQFMQAAAERAGIPEDQVYLALEPEAAALYCKEIIVSKKQGNDEQLESFKPGAQFMLIDLGGGTVDITVHEVQQDSTLRELCPPSGGPWGGTLVDHHISKTLRQLFGDDVFETFKKQSKLDELELQNILELKKRTCKASTGNDGRVLFSIKSLFDTFVELRGEPFDKALEKSSFASKIKTMRGGKLKFEPNVFQEAFDESKQKLIDHIKNLLKEHSLRGVRTLVMVGGFSESEIMKEAVRKEFEGQKTVIIPDDASLAVVKGAVLFGHKTNSVSSRILRHTYGVSTAVPFDSRIHPEHRRHKQNGEDKCEDVFEVFMRRGTSVVPNRSRYTHTFLAPFVNSQRAPIEIYQSDLENPEFVFGDGCKQVAELLLTLQKSSKSEKQKIDVTMWFGDTVLHVEAREHDTNNKIGAKFNFLI